MLFCESFCVTIIKNSVAPKKVKDLIVFEHELTEACLYKDVLIQLLTLLLGGHKGGGKGVTYLQSHLVVCVKI